MDFTKEQFIRFCYAMAKPGITVDLEAFYGGFGYFEMKPYANGSTIRYNVESISNTGNGIELFCTTRIREFNVGNCMISEHEFMRYAKEISLYGNFSTELTDIYNQITNE